MKHTLILILSLFTAVASWAQSFEGEIIYANTYKSKAPNVTDEQWSSMMGNTYNYYIKGAQYKSVANGQLVQWQLYRSADNKLHSKLANSEAAFWNDGGVNEDTVLKSEIKKGAVEILGYKCDELTLTCKNGVQKYYYSSKLAVDPKLYVNHKFGNWYDMLMLTKSMPLKMIVDAPQFSMESVATAVKPAKLEDKFFELPAGMQTQKSPY
ncbi:MAG TPA: hypothetical protein VF629_10565 [Hymenobacter sp.]|jgi:hypothetical protein|uniref:hypothetical protein n=1 Tax=Hymenobacter sp. TaxID=1898978 RepID=UPI002ED89E54